MLRLEGFTALLKHRPKCVPVRRRGEWEKMHMCHFLFRQLTIMTWEEAPMQEAARVSELELAMPSAYLLQLPLRLQGSLAWVTLVSRFRQVKTLLPYLLHPLTH